MSVRLQSFQYLPRGTDGWGSRLLHFGEMFTAVQGPNGTLESQHVVEIQ